MALSEAEELELLELEEAEFLALQQQPVLPLGQQEVVNGNIGVVAPNRVVGSPSFVGAGVIEPAATLISGVVAEPIAGLAGIAQGLNPFAEDGAAAQAVESTREALTFQPRTQVGQESLQAVGEVLAPVGEALSGAEKVLGDAVFKATDSPALAAAAATLPTAVLEFIGAKGIGRAAKATKKVGVSRGQIKSALEEASPAPEDLKGISRQVFKELDNSGVRLKSKVFEGMVAKINKAAKSQGLSSRTTPKALGAIQEFEDVVGLSPSLSEIDDIRTVAQGVARTLDPTEAAIGKVIISEVDNFLDGLSPKALVSGGKIAAKDIAPKYRAARNLWGRARKSELISEALDQAGLAASGLENGIRVEFGKIIRSKKLRKFFNESELSAMKDLVKGDRVQNFAKLIGRFGLSEGRATNVLSALSGVAAGGVAGGGFGAFAVPAAGTVARGIASKLTQKKAGFINALTKAGSDGEAIAKAYLNSVPSKLRSTKELTDLLSDPSIDLSGLLASSNKRLKEAAEIASGRRVIGEVIGLGATTAAISEETK